MAFVGTNNIFDIFFSYEQQIEKKLIRLCDALKKRCDVKIFLNDKSKDIKSEIKSDEAILSSKVFICCLTKAYTFSKKCQNEIALAYTKDKPIIVLMFEKLQSQDLCTIVFALSNISKFNLYDDLKILDVWDGSLFDLIIRSIEVLLKRRIRKLTTETTIKKPLKRGSIGLKTPISNVISSTTYNNNEGLLTPSAAIVTFEAEEYGTSQKETVREDETFSREQLKLEKLKSNTFLGYSYGYNRMIYVPSRQRFLITSSYNRNIVSIDYNGNWIEKRNPGRMLQQPYAICITPYNQILVGDNIAKCIFVFDLDLNYLKKIADKTINGFFDMMVDKSTNELYVVSLYESLIGVIDCKSGRLLRKIFISTPAYIHVTSTRIFVISSADLLFVIDKITLQANYTIRIKHNKYVNGLFIDEFENLYTTAHIINENDEDKEKEAYLCYISFKNDDVKIKRVNLGLTQVNSFILFENKRLVFISDTHIDIFKFNGFSNGLMNDLCEIYR